MCLLSVPRRHSRWSVGRCHIATLPPVAATSRCLNNVVHVNTACWCVCDLYMQCVCVCVEWRGVAWAWHGAADCSDASNGIVTSSCLPCLAQSSRTIILVYRLALQSPFTLAVRNSCVDGFKFFEKIGQTFLHSNVPSHDDNVR